MGKVAFVDGIWVGVLALCTGACGTRSNLPGQPGTGGATVVEGGNPSGGTILTGGSAGLAGTDPGSGGSQTGGAQGGSSGASGATDPGGSTGTTGGPCDIYAAEGGPCVAAHSTVRALLARYNGPLYQVRREDGELADIGVVAPGGLADAANQDAFCGESACTISIIYDQSGLGNHLTKAPGGVAQKTPDNEADAKALPIMIGGQRVYGEHSPPGVGYRNNATTGVATGNKPETMYMITSGDYYNDRCCFDYGNMETNNVDHGAGAAETIYFGSCTIWGKGAGAGPWVMLDLSNSLWAGNTAPYEGNTPVTYKYVTAMLKGDQQDRFALKVADAQTSTLTTIYDGRRPSIHALYPLRKEGAIGLGISGDNSNAGQGNFFEGLITAHYSSDGADEAVQANIVAAGYGR